jgi:hypothetical protein
MTELRSQQNKTAHASRALAKPKPSLSAKNHAHVRESERQWREATVAATPPVSLLGGERAPPRVSTPPLSHLTTVP